MEASSKVLFGTGAAVLAAAVGYYFHERNTEQPDYRLILKDGRFEIRRYPALLVAETFTTGPREQALNRGFRRLADYIFAKSRYGEKVSMTAPVLQDGAGKNVWRTAFIMPSRYTRATLPQPPEGVSIGETQPRRMAAVRFSGRADDEAFAKQESELKRWIASNHHRSNSSAEYAFYNSPFIPAFLRRNEVMIPVQS